MNIKTQYNSIGKEYLQGQKEFFSEREHIGKKLITEFMGELSGKTVLDMGCGDGSDLETDINKGAAKVIGIDPSEYMVSLAKERLQNKAQIILGEYDDIPLADNSVDIVVGRYSMHYLYTLDDAYEEIHRVLKPGGSFIILVPQPASDVFMAQEKDEKGRTIIAIPLYNNKVTVRYPIHTMEEYFSDTFLRFFTLEHYREFDRVGVQSDKTVPTAMVIHAVKK